MAPSVLLVASPAAGVVAVAVAAAATERMELMLVNPTSLLLFVAGAVLLLLIPGPAVLYIVSRSIAHGRSAGLISALGIAVGTMFHVAAATFGLSALLASSVLAFQFVKYAGAAYLVFLGIRVLQGRREDILNTCTGQTSLRSIFAQGVLVNLLNPKTALFFLSFLPQFVSPARGHATLQIFQLGVLFALMAWLSDSVWALLAGIVAARLRGSPHLRRVQRKVSGGALIVLGLASAFSGARTK